jgi:hypothetical protein
MTRIMTPPFQVSLLAGFTEKVRAFAPSFSGKRLSGPGSAKASHCFGPGLGHADVMNPADSALDSAAIAYARALLRKPMRRQRMGPVLAAAAFAAFSAVTFATVMIMAPPAVVQHLPSERLGD